jgi:hypothetical protein
MIICAETPLDRALAKREQIERELRKCPDFQLYLIAKAPKDRARMERLLVNIPMFRLWRTLTRSIERARPRFAASTPGHIWNEVPVRRSEVTCLATSVSTKAMLVHALAISSKSLWLS